MTEKEKGRYSMQKLMTNLRILTIMTMIMSDENHENTNARNAIKDIEIEIDDAYDETEVNDEEKDKKNYVSNAKTNAKDN